MAQQRCSLLGLNLVPIPYRLFAPADPSPKGKEEPFQLF